ncbi:MAG: hypothetical protein ABWX83_03215, partial [Luteibacter sp.]
MMHNDENPRPRFLPRGRAGLALVAAGLLALGGVTGAAVMAQTRPSISMAPAKPIAIRSLSSAGIVTIRGRVAEGYGNKFVLDDGTGRALIETGPEGDQRALVATGAPVTVQGRFERGSVHAAFLVGPDGKVLALGPLAGPPHGPHDGPDRGPGAPPLPPRGADGKAPPPPPSITSDTAAALSPPPAST